VRDFINANDTSANINIFYTNPPDNNDPPIGIAWVSAACSSSKYRSAIIESYYNTDVQNAQVYFSSFFN